ncbi:hypothetical protein C8R43DRAFT_1039093 [Mycena crocata]|nr:hypothetical protein C8R43DRAFT_1039093 [Mycena crocata]
MSLRCAGLRQVDVSTACASPYLPILHLPPFFSVPSLHLSYPHRYIYNLPPDLCPSYLPAPSCSFSSLKRSFIAFCFTSSMARNLKCIQSTDVHRDAGYRYTRGCLQANGDSQRAHDVPLRLPFPLPLRRLGSSAGSGMADRSIRVLPVPPSMLRVPAHHPQPHRVSSCLLRSNRTLSPHGSSLTFLIPDPPDQTPIRPSVYLIILIISCSQRPPAPIALFSSLARKPRGALSTPASSSAHSAYAYVLTFEPALRLPPASDANARERD